jgi:hypothetical protein
MTHACYSGRGRSIRSHLERRGAIQVTTPSGRHNREEVLVKRQDGRIRTLARDRLAAVARLRPRRQDAPRSATATSPASPPTPASGGTA